MTGFFDDGRADDAPLTAKELATMNEVAGALFDLATTLVRATTVGDCREIDTKVDALAEIIDR